MAFRLLHLADLHLGQRFHDHDRSEDEEHALEQVLGIAATEAIDVVVLAGDVFDVAHPGARESERYHRFLARLVLECGVGTVVVVAGNHDHPSRIEGPRALFEVARVHARGVWRLDEGPEKCLVPLRSRAGELVGHALAVPFLRDGDVRMRRPGEAADVAAEGYVRALEERLALLHAAVPRALPFVAIAHAFATGGRIGGGELPIQVGGEARVPAAAFAGEAAYLALGHLHRAQVVSGHEHWRYCGSLLPTGFDELATSREVVVAEITEHGPARARRVPLTPYRRLLRLEGDPLELERQLEALPEPEAGSAVPWARAYVQLPGGEARRVPGLAQRLADLAQERGWQLLGVELRVARSSAPDLSEPEPPDFDLTDCTAVFDEVLQRHGIEDEAAASLRQSFGELQQRCDELLGEDV